MLKELGVLGRWMTDQSVEPGQLDPAAIESFLAARRAAGQRGVPSLRAMHPLVSFLLEECARVSVGSAKGRTAELRSVAAAARRTPGPLQRKLRCDRALPGRVGARDELGEQLALPDELEPECAADRQIVGEMSIELAHATAPGHGMT